MSFLEVNTRLQVEHPVTEEVSGIDLVREQFAIADGAGARATPTRGRAATRSSSGSTARTRAATSCPRPARSPAGGRRPGPGCGWTPACGPGMTVPQAFDSLLAKLIVTGASRAEALERARRALDEFVVGGHADRAAVPPRGRARPGVHRRAVRACTPAGSRPSSTTTVAAVGRSCGRGRGRRPQRERWWSRSAASGWR